MKIYSMLPKQPHHNKNNEKTKHPDFHCHLEQLCTKHYHMATIVVVRTDSLSNGNQRVQYKSMQKKEGIQKATGSRFNKENLQR